MKLYQLKIQRKFRKQYCINCETERDFALVEDGIFIVKVDNKKRPFKDLYGILKKTGSSDDFIEEIRGR